MWMEEEKDRIDALQPSAEMADARYNVWVAPYVIESHAHSWWMSHVTPVFPVMADCFPHTRALLSALGRRYKGVDDDDDDERTLVGQVVALLVDEKEDELKGLLEATYGMDGQAVGRQWVGRAHADRRADRGERPGAHAQTSRRRWRRALCRPHSHPTPDAHEGNSCRDAPLDVHEGNSPRNASLDVHEGNSPRNAPLDALPPLLALVVACPHPHTGNPCPCSVDCLSPGLSAAHLPLAQRQSLRVQTHPATALLRLLTAWLAAQSRHSLS